MKHSSTYGGSGRNKSAHVAIHPLPDEGARHMRRKQAALARKQAKQAKIPASLGPEASSRG